MNVSLYHLLSPVIFMSGHLVVSMEESDLHIEIAGTQGLDLCWKREGDRTSSEDVCSPLGCGVRSGLFLSQWCRVSFLVVFDHLA